MTRSSPALVAALVAALCVILAVAVVADRTMNGLLETVGSRDHEHRILENLETLLLELDNAETGQRGFLITGQPNYLEPYERAVSAIHDTVIALDDLAASNPAEQQAIARLKPLIAQKLSELDQTVNLRKQQGFEAAQKVVLSNVGKQIMDQIRAVVGQMTKQEQDVLARTDREARESAKRTQLISWGGRAVSITLLIAVFLVLMREVSVRKRAEEEMRRLNMDLDQRGRELEATNKELEAFTYSVSHDLRAPLRHIDGFGKLLMEEFAAQLPADAQRYLTRVRDGTKQMGQLVDDLLNLARVGRRELSMQVTGLGSLVQEVVVEQKTDTPGREIEWKLGALPFVECDPALMKQVFANLISNAVKYTRPRPKAVIEVGVSRQNGQPAVFVRDNGVGFNMKYADKLFGVFQRLHRPEDFEGTGVGLATVQRIIHKHGGRVWGEAELDKGATFYFTLGKSENSGQHIQAATGGKP